jgi:hypothetical protein
MADIMLTAKDLITIGHALLLSFVLLILLKLFGMELIVTLIIKFYSMKKTFNNFHLKKIKNKLFIKLSNKIVKLTV